MHAAEGEEIVGAAASVGEREVHVPAFWKMEAVVEAEDVVAVAVGSVQIGGRGVGAAVPLAGNVRCFLTLQTDDECQHLHLWRIPGYGRYRHGRIYKESSRSYSRTTVDVWFP